MEIKVEVSLTPEELRRFLGLPDVGGLQDDLIDFLRDRMGAATEAAGDFDATDFVKTNFDTLRKAPGKGFKTIMSRVRLDQEPASSTKRSTKSTGGKPTKRRAPRKKA